MLALLKLPLQLLPREAEGHSRAPLAFVLFCVRVCHAHGIALLLEHLQRVISFLHMKSTLCYPTPPTRTYNAPALAAGIGARCYFYFVIGTHDP